MLSMLDADIAFEADHEAIDVAPTTAGVKLRIPVRVTAREAKYSAFKHAADGNSVGANCQYIGVITESDVAVVDQLGAIVPFRTH